MSRIIPTLRYRNALAAIDWLEKAFGFERHLVVEGEAGRVEHAQLTLGDSAMIMLGSVRDDDLGKMTAPPEAGGRVTQSPYVVVSDVEAHHARAKAAGAEIVMPLEAQSYGGSLYSAKDPEGHLWHFGSYDPWAPEPEDAAAR